jgi:hypothetical protein
MLAQFKSARLAGAPLVAIQTPDPAATIQEFIAKHGETDEDGNPVDPPIISHDTVRGFLAYNEKGKAAIAAITGGTMMVNPAEAMNAAMAFPERTVLYMFNMHRHLTDDKDHAQNVQALWNLRDAFKSNERTAVMFAPQISLPPELAHDVLVLDELLPDRDSLKEIALSVYDGGDIKHPDAATLGKVVDALAGLAAFPAEQAVAMSLRKKGVDLSSLWERKRQMIQQTKGLSVWRGTETLDDLGGLANLKAFLRKIIKGKRRPRAFVYVDEIEKSINPEGDLSGTSQDQLATFLSFMQDENASGMIFIGPPGTGKSALAKAAGNEAEVLTIPFDLGGMKGGIVGQSEATIRNALKVCKAIGGDGLVFIATCNSIANLPPELRRRFKLGTFFIDLPDADERAVIWKHFLGKFDLKGQAAKLPDDKDWTGAEIQQACELAWRLDETVIESAKYVVPVARASSEKIQLLREQAHGRYISASKPGLYEMPQAALPSPSPEVAPTRKVKVQAD